MSRDELIEQGVHYAAEALNDPNGARYAMERWGREARAVVDALARKGWRPVVEDDETVERLAKASWLSVARRRCDVVPEDDWDAVHSKVADCYRNDARTMIRALRGEASE